MATARAEAAFTLQLLHAADFDGATGALDNVEPFSALLDAFRAERPDETLVLSSGDNYIPGPRFFAAEDDSLAPLLGVPGPGRADIALLNAMGFQASAVGNHDLDTGTEGFAALLSPDDGADEDGNLAATPWPGASFPYLSANLGYAADEALAPLVVAAGQPASTIPGGLTASTTIEVGGDTVGVVGATTPELASITSTGTLTVLPEDGDDLDALAAEIQPAVNALIDEGIDKIVLLAHMQQIAIEQALATRLDGVDIIVAGGSNTILADADDALRAGDVAIDTYPLEYASASGEPVLVVNTDADYRYLGRLVVGFDDDGVLLPATLDESVNGAYAATSDAAAALGAMPVPEVASIATALRDVLATRDGNIVGRTDVYLDGRRSQVRTEETNLGNLTADANLWLARQADPSVAVSLKNGGGIRSDIGLVVQPPGSNDPADVEFLPPPANVAAGKAEGDISEFDLQGALRFNNGLTLLTLTAAELVDVLEHAVAASGDGATPGQFPQVGGLSLRIRPGAARARGRRHERRRDAARRAHPRGDARRRRRRGHRRARRERRARRRPGPADPHRDPRLHRQVRRRRGRGVRRRLSAEGVVRARPGGPRRRRRRPRARGLRGPRLRAGRTRRVPAGVLRRHRVRRGRDAGRRGRAHPEPRRGGGRAVRALSLRTFGHRGRGRCASSRVGPDGVVRRDDAVNRNPVVVVRTTVHPFREWSVLAMAVMSVRLKDEVNEELERVAERLRRSKGWVINEALAEFLEHEALRERRRLETLEGLADVEAGRLVEGDRVHE